jgi:hypothetical protein
MKTQKQRDAEHAVKVVLCYWIAVLCVVIVLIVVLFPQVQP